jgi:hypothetical protein
MECRTELIHFYHSLSQTLSSFEATLIELCFLLLSVDDFSSYAGIEYFITGHL